MIELSGVRRMIHVVFAIMGTPKFDLNHGSENSVKEF